MAQKSIYDLEISQTDGTICPKFRLAKHFGTNGRKMSINFLLISPFMLIFRQIFNFSPKIEKNNDFWEKKSTEFYDFCLLSVDFGQKIGQKALERPIFTDFCTFQTLFHQNRQKNSPKITQFLIFGRIPLKSQVYLSRRDLGLPRERHTASFHFSLFTLLSSLFTLHFLLFPSAFYRFHGASGSTCRNREKSGTLPCKIWDRDSSVSGGRVRGPRRCPGLQEVPA